MKLQRFINDFDLSGSRVVSTDTKLIDQIRKVFRLTEGDSVILCDGKGSESKATIDVITKEQVIFSLTETVARTPPPLRNVRLVQAILKKEHFELVVQKATECGVAEIIPVITERTVKLSLNHERLVTIAREAAEQSGRAFLPTIHHPVTLETFLESKNNNTKIILDPTTETPLKNIVAHKETVDILIGPEGGFSPREVSLAEIQGFSRATLGTLTLRAETAGIIATYLSVHET